jgi:hypothetical protein
MYFTRGKVIVVNLLRLISTRWSHLSLEVGTAIDNLGISVPPYLSYKKCHV